MKSYDWKKFREISDEIGAYFMVDMAHYSGLIAGHQYPNPIEHAHVVTSTTHKTLRGARSAMILTNYEHHQLHHHILICISHLLLKELVR